MNKRFSCFKESDSIIACLSLVIICANVGYVFADRLDIPLSQIIHSTVVGLAIAALTVLAVVAITRILDIKRANIATYSEKLKH